MPAQSQQQQKLFGLALAFKRGEVKSSEVSDEIKGIADRMSEKEIEDFAKTTHKGLPKMKEQLRKIVREILRDKAISEMNEESVNEAASKEAMGIAALTGTRGSAVEEFINKHELDGGKLFRSIKKANLRGRLNFVSALAGKDGNPNQKLTIKLHKKNESVVNERYSDFIKAKNLTDIVALSKKKKNATFYVTDDNNSRIGTFYLKNGKFAKATTANANYDLQNSKTKLKDRNDVIYKYKVDESIINESPSSEELRIVMMAVRKIAKYRNVPIDQSINDVLNAVEQLKRDIKKGKIKK